MFNLETAIRTWLAQFDYRTGYTDDDLREIERHIRDHVSALEQGGASPEDAFRKATASFGTFDESDDEFAKVYWEKQRRRRTLGRALSARLALLSHYAVSALRSMRRHPGFSAANILGLTAGLTVAVLTLVFVTSETGFDRFHDDADRIHRILRSENEGRPSTKSEFLLPEVLTSDASGVESFVRLSWDLEQEIGVGDDTWRESGYFSVDSSFFDFFSFELVIGNPETALRDPDAIVVTESIARKYFGRTDVVGERLLVNRSTERIVKGVAADPPVDSHLQFSFLSPIDEFRGYWTEGFESWSTAETHTYVRLAEGVSRESVEDALPGILAGYLPEEDITARSYRLQPLNDVHLHSAGVANEIQPQGDIRRIRLFSAIAVLILVIACVNYVNLATARSMNRAREAGLRKVVGAHRRQLTVQFLGESVLFSLAAALVSLLVAVTLVPAMNDMFVTAWSAIEVLRLAPVLLALALVLGVLSGIYPSLVQSRFEPAVVLKGFETSRGSSRMRDVLVVFQFVVTTVLIVGAIVLHRQMQFIQSTDLGFEREHRIVVNIPGMANDQVPIIRAEAAELASVTGVSAASNIPSDSWGYPVFMPSSSDSSLTMKLFAVDFDFIELMGLELASGRGFSADRPSDSTRAFILNEAAARALGWTNASALGRGGRLSWVDREGEVVGVVRDFHFRSLHRQIEPAILTIAPGFFRKVILAVQPGTAQHVVRQLEDQWTRIMPGWTFDYTFLGDRMDAMYERETRMAGLVGMLTVISVILAGLGLFGLVSFVTRRRTREIGVRKVLGAGTIRLVGALSQEFALLLFVAFIIAVPIGWWVSTAWLSGFAYSIDLGAGVFLSAAGTVTLLAIVSVVGQTARAASMPPVEAIRS